MNNQCVVYVTDVEYSFPTILSALQARKFASPATDVCVLMSEHLDNFEELKALLARSSVILSDATEALQDSLGKLDSSHFQGRISVSTMAARRPRDRFDSFVGSVDVNAGLGVERARVGVTVVDPEHVVREAAALAHLGEEP